MLNSLETHDLLTSTESSQLQGLRLPVDQPRLSLAALMLAPVLELSVHDGATTPTEFEAIETYITSLECEFELAARNELESIGTDMGMLPMVSSSWNPRDFQLARTLLAQVLSRLPEEDAHAIRNAIAKALLGVAQAAGDHLITIHVVDSEDRLLIHDIIQSLKLETTSEGLNLRGKSGN